jgi:hypothetical protein
MNCALMYRSLMMVNGRLAPALSVAVVIHLHIRMGAQVSAVPER